MGELEGRLVGALGVGTATVGPAVTGDVVVGDLVGDTVMGDAVMGDAVVGDAVVGDAVGAHPQMKAFSPKASISVLQVCAGTAPVHEFFWSGISALTQP